MTIQSIINAPFGDYPAHTVEAAKTIKIQQQFICPIWTVWFGTSVKVYFTRHHAEQMVRALTLNGTECRSYDGTGNPC